MSHIYIGIKACIKKTVTCVHVYAVYGFLQKIIDTFLHKDHAYFKYMFISKFCYNINYTIMHVYVIYKLLYKKHTHKKLNFYIFFFN